MLNKAICKACLTRTTNLHFLGNGIAIPHGTLETRSMVKNRCASVPISTRY